MIKFTAVEAQKLVEEYHNKIEMQDNATALEWVENEIVPNILENARSYGKQHYQAKAHDRQSITDKGMRLLAQAGYKVSKTNNIITIQW